MGTEIPNNSSEQADKLRQAQLVFEELDNCRNLHSGLAVILFCMSAGLGVYAFFHAVDLPVRL